VEAAVGRVAVLPGAVIVERPAFHGRVGAVVGQFLNYGIARAAVGAVDVGIVEAWVGRVEEFGEAIGTDGKVGGDAGCRGSGVLAMADFEVFDA
jgi:hypothetical protein